MAFPQVADSATSISGGGTAHTVNLPANIANGNLLLGFFVCDDDETIGWPGDWTEIFELAYLNGCTLSVAYRNADGNEGATITVNTSSDEQAGAIVHRITGHSTSQAPQASTGASGSSVSPDPDSLAPTGGAKDYMWIAVEGNDHNDQISSYPANYTDNQTNIKSGDASSAASLGLATRELNAVSEDPDAFTLGGTEQWIAVTVAIHPGGATEYSLVVDPGSYILTGKACPLFIDQLLVVDTDSYILTGLPVDLFRHRAVLANAGEYILTGQLANLLKSSVFIPDSGEYVLTGQLVSLFKHRTLVAGAGTYLITGTAADLFASRLLEVAGGVYLLTGQDVTLTYTITGYKLTCDPGSYILTGKAASSLKHSSLVVNSGIYVLTGTALDLFFTRVIGATAGSYALTGQTANLAKSIVLNVASGSYELSGQSLDLIFTRVLQATNGNYALTGQIVNLLKDSLFLAEPGGYIVAGKNVTLHYITGEAGEQSQTARDFLIVINI